jgi:hypothetical protein
VRREGAKGVASGAAGVVWEAEFGGKGGEVVVGGLGFRGRKEVRNDDRALGVQSVEYGGEVVKREVDGGVFERGCEGGLGMKGKEVKLGVG